MATPIDIKKAVKEAFPYAQDVKIDIPPIEGLTVAQIQEIKSASTMLEAQRLAQDWNVSLPTIERLRAPMDTTWKPDPVWTQGARDQGVPIPITQTELSQIKEAEASGTCVGAMKAYYTPKTYTVTLKDGTKVKVEALSQESAEKKAEDEGYDVAWVTWSPTSSEKTTVEKAIAEDTIEVKDGKTGETMLVDKDGWNSLDAKYQNIAKSEGFDAMYSAFDTDHIKSETGEYIGKTDYSDLETYDKTYGTNYAGIFKQQGYSAVSEAINKDKEAQESAIAKIDNYKTGDGYNLLKARLEGVTPEEMNKAGFDKETTDWVEDSYQASIKTGVALPGVRNWYNPYTDKTISDAEYQAIVARVEARSGTKIGTREFYAELAKNPEDAFILARDTANRLTIEGVATMFFAPAAVMLPEIRRADIAPLTWVVGAAQIAAWTLPVVPKGVLPFVSAGAGSIFGYSTAQNWDKLSTGQKVLAVAGTALVSLPALMAVGKFASPSAVQVPTNRGTKITVWRGFQVNGKPIIGLSEGRLAIGTKGITRPLLSQIERGWHPVTKIETTLLGTRKALKQMGVSETDITKVMSVWKEAVPVFARKASPAGVTPRELLIGSERLTPEEVAAVLQVAKSSKYAKKIEMVYGSSTIRPFLKKVLRDWRKWHDLDIQTKMSAAELPGFVDDVMVALRKTGTKIRLSADNPGVVEKFMDGKWVKITDIHTKDILPGSVEAWETGAYGYAYAEKPVTIKLPGIGKLKLMTLSETGLRKAGAMTRFQVTEIAPYAYRLNDIADFYIIVLNYKGVTAANKVAQAFGYTPSRLLEVAAKNPRPLAVWGFSPSGGGTGTPSVAITVPAVFSSAIPSSLKASLARYTPITSAATYVVSTPLESVGVISPSGMVSPNVIAYPLSIAGVSQVIKGVSPNLSSATARELSSAIVSSVGSLSKGASSAAVSSSISQSLSPYVSSGVISSSVASLISKAVSASPYASPSTKPSVSPSPSLTPSPSPSSSVSPSPSLSPSVVVPVSPRPLPRLVTSKGEKFYKIAEGSIAWKQGMFWKYIPPPWTQEAPVNLDHPPKGAKYLGEKTPEKTIQMIGKRRAKVPKDVSIDLGVVDIRISDYGQRIEFTGKGLETVVGKSLSGPTRGMSVPATGVMRVKKYKRPKKAVKRANRGKMLVGVR